MKISDFRMVAASLIALLVVMPAVRAAPPDMPEESPRTGGEALLISVSHGVLGPYLADAHGRALYLREAGDTGQNGCNSACQRIWPPLLAPSLPSSGAPLVRDVLIGSVEHRGGMRQVTYNGHSLHYYALDLTARESLEYDWVETFGQGVHDEWGRWSLLTPAGERVERLLHPPRIP